MLFSHIIVWFYNILHEFELKRRKKIFKIYRKFKFLYEIFSFQDRRLFTFFTKISLKKYQNFT